MTQRLCWDMRQDIRAAHVGLSMGHFIHSFHEHTPRICYGPSTVLGVGESAMRMTLYFPLPTSRCGGAGVEGADAGQGGAGVLERLTGGVWSTEQRLPGGGEPRN